MGDTFSKNTRSRIMRAVRSVGNKTTEIALVRIWRKYKCKGWRRRYDLYGKPDFVFPMKRVAVFADGCFWHGHGCRNTKPRQNKAFWLEKIARNRVRDRAVTHVLRNRGWKVFRIWECQISKQKIPLNLIILLS